MSGGNFCVAGWDPSRKRMVRPIPAGRVSWPGGAVAESKLWPGKQFVFTEAGIASRGELPHRTEDTVVETADLKFGKLAPDGKWLQQIAGSVSASLDEAFGGHVHWRVYRGERYHAVVERGTDGPSLGAIEIAAKDLQFVDDDKKLRAVVSDGEGRFSLPIVSHQIRESYRTGGLAALRAQYSKGKLHVQLGLARAYDKYPDECFVMFNGVYVLS